MRTLNRNARTFYYALYEGKKEVRDEWGNLTGEWEAKHSSPVMLRNNVSPARGESDTDMFGISLSYDRAIVTSDMTNPLTETSVLWIDTMPVINEDGTTETPYDYRVVRIGKSINGIAIAVSKVDVS